MIFLSILHNYDYDGWISRVSFARLLPEVSLGRWEPLPVPQRSRQRSARRLRELPPLSWEPGSIILFLIFIPTPGPSCSRRQIKPHCVCWITTSVCLFNSVLIQHPRLIVSKDGFCLFFSFQTAKHRAASHPPLRRYWQLFSVYLIVRKISIKPEHNSYNLWI